MQAATRTDTISVLCKIDQGLFPNPTALSNTINKAFLAPMSIFTELAPCTSRDAYHPDQPPISETCVFRKIASLNPAKASGPDNIPAWLLKENADLVAPVVTDILNCSYKGAKLPHSWKHADITPIPKQTPVQDVNKHLRPISLTPIISKLAVEFIIDRYIKPAILAKVDPRQFSTVPSSSTTEALISMIHEWNSASDGTGATVRAVLFDFKKAFHLIDHHILINKLHNYDLPEAILFWIIDFLTDRKQRVQLGSNCFSEWKGIPAGVP